MKKSALLLLILILGSVSVFAHAEGTADIEAELSVLEGKRLDAPLKSLLKNEVVEAQLIHEDGSLSYYTIKVENSVVVAAEAGRAERPTIQAFVKEKVISEVKVAQDKKVYLKAAMKNKDIEIKGVGWKGFKLGIIKMFALRF
ncbi:MAG: hypothetical protein WC595_02305 [Candidatus Nanoarchaeia archaeon]